MKGGFRWFIEAAVLLLLFASCPDALGQDEAGEPARAADGTSEPSAAPEATGCFPACRAGYVCSNGECVSTCNPPCPVGESCVDGAYCEPRTQGSGVYEPPPPPPKRQAGFAERVHSGLAFHMGFGGSRETELPGGSTSRADLDTTYGVNLRTDVPVVKYLLLGPLFQLAAYRADLAPKPNRDYAIDIDLFVRGRFPAQLDSVALQFWAGVPVGLTLSLLGDTTQATGSNQLSSFGVGWNIGFLLGGAIHFSKSFGMFAEGGWLQRRFGHAFENRDNDVRFELSQTNLSIGFMFWSK